MNSSVSHSQENSILLAEREPATVRQFSELFGDMGSVIYAGTADEVRQLVLSRNFSACIVVDDLMDVSGLEMVRELHRISQEIPIVLIADLSKRRIPLEEVSVGWSGCYIIKDREDKYIGSAHNWIRSYLASSSGHGGISESQESSENRELLHSQRLESVGMLASGIAHDFNNILMAILGNASIAKDKIGREHEAFRFMNIIEQCAERASALSNSLMRYARGEKSEWIPILLPDHVDELLNIISTGLPGHVIVEKDFEEVLPVEGDATKLQQVIMNICLNAGDAMNERKIHGGGISYMGVLRIGIHQVSLSNAQIMEHDIQAAAVQRGFVRMDFSDNGAGMSEATVQSIFRPFFTTKKSGRGLGLSSVRGIIDEHGGFIEVQSEPGVGTTFSVYLPCCEVVLDDQAEGLLQVFSSSTVLVIEPDEEMRRLIGLSLQHMEYQVLLVEELDEALGVFFNHRQSISLILLNIADPERGAVQAIESLRRVDEGIPIVLISEHDRSVMKPLIGPGLANEFVELPFRPDVLLRIVAETIKKKSIS